MTGAFGKGVSISGGMSKKEAVKTVKFYLAAAVMCVVSSASCISQQLPALLQNLGHADINKLISIMTAGIAIGTIVEGLLCSRLGIRNTMILILCIYASGFLLLTFNRAVAIALVCLAFGHGTVTTLMPIVVRTIFGGREYAAIWSLIATAGSIGTIVATPVWGMVYDLSGSYTLGLIAAPVMLMVALGALVLIFRGTER